MRVPPGVTISGPLIDKCRASVVAHQSPSMTSARTLPADSRTTRPSAVPRDRPAIAFSLWNADGRKHNAARAGRHQGLRNFLVMWRPRMPIAVRWKPPVALMLVGLALAA